MKKRIFEIEYVIALLLCLAGGFIEAYSLYYRGFWSMMMTGNIVYSMVAIINGNYNLLLIYVLAIILFTGGVFLACLIEDKIAKKDKNKYIPLELCLILISLLIVMAIPTICKDNIHETDISAWPNVISNSVLAIGGGILFKSFNTFNSHSFVSTMMTANLARFASSLYEGIFGPNKSEARRSAFQYALLIIVFALSAGICYAFYYYFWGKIEGSLFISYYPNITLFVPLAVILLCLILVLRKAKKQEKIIDHKLE